MVCHRVVQVGVEPWSNDESSQRIFKLGRRIERSLTISIHSDCFIRINQILHSVMSLSLRTDMDTMTTPGALLYSCIFIIPISVCFVTFQLLKCRHFRCPHDLFDVAVLILMQVLLLARKYLLLDHLKRVGIVVHGGLAITFNQIMHLVNLLLCFSTFSHSDSRHDCLW